MDWLTGIKINLIRAHGHIIGWGAGRAGVARACRHQVTQLPKPAHTMQITALRDMHFARVRALWHIT
jgi:hypothetical protein